MNRSWRGESGLPFICFTDDPATSCDGWEIRPLEQMFSADDIRNQRSYKLQPHLVLPEFDQSLYMDNSIQLRALPERLFEAADLSTGMCLPRHSHRESLLDEFLLIAQHSIDDPRRVMEQLQHYQNAFPEVVARPVFWCALLLRDHHAPRVRVAMAIWLAHVYRYSRRDQLSNSAAFHLAGLKPGVLAFDNYESEFHTWPHLNGRKTEQRLWKDETADAVVLRSEFLELQQVLNNVQREHGLLLQERDGLRVECSELQHERATLLHERGAMLGERDALLGERDALRLERDLLLHSTSWRVTAPLRGIKEAAFFLRKKNQEDFC